MILPVECLNAFRPHAVRCGSITLGPLTLAQAATLGTLGIDVTAGQVAPCEAALAAFVLAGRCPDPTDETCDGDFRAFEHEVKGVCNDLVTAVNTILASAMNMWIKPLVKGGDGPIKPHPHGLGWPLELAEWLCGEYGWTFDEAAATPVARVFALIAASRQRHRGSHAGLDYVERIYAAELKRGEKKSIFAD